MKVKEQTEIERKFLLKKFPEVNSKAHVFYKNDVKYQSITQFYLEDGSKIRRNVIKDTENGVYKNQRIEFTRVHKTGEGVKRTEVVEFIDLEEYSNLKKQAVSVIEKNREEIEFNDHNFLIDSFINIDIVIAEIEIIPEVHGRDDIDSFTLPEEIQRYVLMEVTHLEQFKNKNLAEKL